MTIIYIILAILAIPMGLYAMLVIKGVLKRVYLSQVLRPISEKYLVLGDNPIAEGFGTTKLFWETVIPAAKMWRDNITLYKWGDHRPGLFIHYLQCYTAWLSGQPEPRSNDNSDKISRLRENLLRSKSFQDHQEGDLIDPNNLSQEDLLRLHKAIHDAFIIVADALVRGGRQSKNFYFMLYFIDNCLRHLGIDVPKKLRHILEKKDPTTDELRVCMDFSELSRRDLDEFDKLLRESFPEDVTHEQQEEVVAWANVTQR